MDPTPAWYELPIVSVGGWLGVLLGFLYLFLTDRIMTVKRHDAIIADKDRQIAFWRESSQTNAASTDLALGSINQLAREVATSNSLIRSLPGVSERNVS